MACSVMRTVTEPLLVKLSALRSRLPSTIESTARSAVSRGSLET